MKFKIKLSLVFFIVFSLFTFQESFSQCFQIESILVDACGPTEGYNEMVRFKVGNSNINVSNLDVTWPSNSWQGLVQNGTTAAKVAALNANILAAGGCGKLLEPIGGVLPANAKVILVTSYKLDIATNVFGAITQDTYIIFQDNASTSGGHFGNTTATGDKTLDMSFGSCSDSVTYNCQQLVNINGGLGGSSALNDGSTVNFTAFGTPSYVNNGCAAPVEVFTVDAGNSPISACPGATISLTGTAVGQQSVVWSVTPNGGSFSAANSLSTNYTISPSASGTITLTLTATNSCNATKTSTVTLNVNSSVIPTFNAVAPICPGGNLNPLPTTSTNNITGSWSPALNNTQTTTYTFTPNSGQCANTSTLAIVVNPIITPVFSAVPPVCSGANLEPLPTSSTNNITGVWSPVLNDSETTTYTFTPDAGQCAVVATLTVVVSNPSVSITANCVDTDYTLTALTSDSEVSYAWYQGTKLLSEETSNKIIVKATDIYKVVINSEGCTAESTENVTSFYCDIPRGISPNNDTKNDYFDLTNFQVRKLEIFNRYGVKVYSKANYQNEWYGTTDDGKELPDATYYYVIEFESGKSKTGWVYINR